MRAIVNGKIVTEHEVIEGKALVFDEKILGITSDVGGCEQIDAHGGYVTAGLIDVHIHGCLGADASDGDLDGLRRMARGVAAYGVTSFLPTTMTLPYDVLERAFDTVRALMASPMPGEAHALGVNAEGPFLSPIKRGAHERGYLRLPDAEFLIKHADVIRLTTIAPELEGALDCIERVTNQGIRVAIGHTTADYDLSLRAIDAGATQATHTFNAMPTLGHRDPGATGAVLLDERVYCELIADGFHIHPAWFSMLRRLKGDKLILITDCTRAGGLGDGTYELGGQTMCVDGKRCLLPDGTIAGSTLRLNTAVLGLVQEGGASIPEAIYMATAGPARALGVFDKKGTLTPGKDADIAIFDEDFDTLHTIIGGESAYIRN